MNTPGPWVAQGKVRDLLIVRGTDLNQSTIAFVVPNIHRGNLTEQKDNATLIAAAPDLLNALEELLKDFEEFANDNEEAELFPEREQVIAARLAIAKAKGNL